MRPHIGVVAPCGDLPGDFHARLASSNDKTIVLDFFCDVEVRPGRPNGGELIAEVFVDCLKPSGKFDLRFSAVVENDIAAVLVQDLGGFDGGMKKILVGRVQGMIDAKVLRALREEVSIDIDIVAEGARLKSTVGIN